MGVMEGTGEIDIEHFRAWLSSVPFGEELLVHTHCPDGHDFTRFSPDVDGWCCEGCGEDLRIAQNVLQCSTCDCLCWCASCAVSMGGPAAFQDVLLSAVLQLRPAPAPPIAPEAPTPMPPIDDAEKTTEDDSQSLLEEPVKKDIDRTACVKLSITTLAGESAELEVEGWRSTAYVKSLVEGELGIPVVCQSLFCAFSALQEEDCVADYKEGEDVDLFLVVRSEQQVEWLRRISKLATESGNRRHITSALCYAPEEIRSDRLVVREAVSRFGADLQYASEELQGDKEVALAAWKQCSHASAWIAPSLLQDRDFAIQAISESGMRLMTFIAAAPDLARDKELVAAAVAQHGRALACLRPPSEFLQDPDILDLALANGFTLHCGLARANGLNGVPSVVLACVRRDVNQLQRIDDRLRSDVSFVQQLLAIDGRHLNNVSSKLCSDKLIVADAIRNGFTLRGCNEKLKSCHQLVRAAVSKNGLELEYAAMELRADRAVVMAALKQCGLALRFAGVFLQNDRSIVAAAVQQNGDALKFAGAHLRQDAEMVSLSLHVRRT